MTEGDVKEKAYDLEERTALFGESIIRLVQKIPKNSINNPLISQIVRSATSIGANYCEADNSVSDKDFRNKIGICRKESKETKHWLRMLVTANESLKEEARELWREVGELNRIFSRIFMDMTERTGVRGSRKADV